MKIKIDKNLLIKFLCISVFVVIAPFAFAYSLEFILLADILGAEMVILSLVYYFKSTITLYMYKWHKFKSDFSGAVQYFSTLYMSQPRSCLLHGSASFLVIIFGGCLALSFYLWVPVMIMSSGYI